MRRLEFSSCRSQEANSSFLRNLNFNESNDTLLSNDNSYAAIIILKGSCRKNRDVLLDRTCLHFEVKEWNPSFKDYLIHIDLIKSPAQPLLTQTVFDAQLLHVWYRFYFFFFFFFFVSLLTLFKMIFIFLSSWCVFRADTAKLKLSRLWVCLYED